MSNAEQNEGHQSNNQHRSLQRVSDEKPENFSLPQIAGPQHSTDPGQLSQRGKDTIYSI